MKKDLILFIFFIIVSFPSFGQVEVSELLTKLNKLHKENRIVGNGKIQDVFANKTNKTIDIDDKIIPLTNYTANYEDIYNPKLARNLNTVIFNCLDGENCMVDSKTRIDYKSVGFYFKSKKACYDFINLIDEIKHALGDF